MKNNMQKGGVLLWIVIIIVLVIAGYFLFRGYGTSVPATQAAPAAVGTVATTTTVITE